MSADATSRSMSVTSRLSELHGFARSDHPELARIAVAVYDRSSDRLRTFVHSTDGESPLAHYEANLSDLPSLAELAAAGRDRTIDDLEDLGRTVREHTRRLRDAGFRSSYTRPLVDSTFLEGFVFLDSRERAYFSPERVSRLELLMAASGLLVHAALMAVQTIRHTVRLATELSRARDWETGAHLNRMARYAQLIGKHLGHDHGLDDELVEYVHLFAPMHDIGKVGVPDRILLKRGPLSEDERQQMRRHVLTGARIVEALRADPALETLPHLDILYAIVRHHHETLNGGGYPDGLAGGTIPLAARIVAVADVFDALTTSRPYKQAWTVDNALAYLRERAGSVFDADCVAALEECRVAVEEAMQCFAEPGAVAPAHDHEWDLPLR